LAQAEARPLMQYCFLVDELFAPRALSALAFHPD